MAHTFFSVIGKYFVTGMENVSTKYWESKIFNIVDEQAFSNLALEAFRYQYANCTIYNRFVNGIGRNPQQINSIEAIPFLPIEFFKSQKVVSFQGKEETLFYSSGTTGMTPSKHYIYSLSLYKESFIRAFSQMVGNPKDFVFLALLPSYLEREGSSLIYMVKTLMEVSGKPESRFYLHQMEELAAAMEKLHSQNRKTILFGVTYALLDLIAYKQFHLPNLIVFETGGMKGRRKESLRSELHQQLRQGFGVEKIYSEYGMAELLSQAYTFGGENFHCPPWMKILVRDRYDPLQTSLHTSQKGGINVIDLANIHSCCFIATQDIGSLYPDGSFSVWGRFDQAEIRGCNLLVD